MIARHVVVHGRVQGVFFRAETQRAATDLGITGWVRNRSDGSVEATVEGDESAVEQMIDWLGYGPARAHVRDLDIAEVSVTGATTFTVH